MDGITRIMNDLMHTQESQQGFDERQVAWTSPLIHERSYEAQYSISQR